MAFPIAVIQLDVDFAHPDANLAGARALAGDALARGARVVLLPSAFYSDIYRGVEPQLFGGKRRQPRRRLLDGSRSGEQQKRNHPPSVTNVLVLGF